jgi:nucleoid-associated protein YgaU
MKRAGTITVVASALVVSGLVALSAPVVSMFGSDAAPAPVAATGPAATTSPAQEKTPTVTELPDWAKASSPWIIYPDGFRCQGTEGCPNDFRALIGEPGDVLPPNVHYYDPAVDDYDPANPGKFSVFPSPAPGADRGRRPGANGFAVVSGATGKVTSYLVTPDDTLTDIGFRFSIDAARLTLNGEPVSPGVTRIDPGDVLVFP